MNEEKRLGGLVVVGASAGGVDALSTLVATLPPDFAAPVVVAQHLDPSRVSHLGEILALRSTLPVRTVLDREPLAPGVVFVVPADRHVAISDSEVSLRVDSTPRPKPSVDLLFSTAAQSYGERLIAVILSGTGSDGAAGAREVKQAGGTVIIQNPTTAQFPGMPESLPPAIVDIVADVDEIGGLLTDLLTGVYLPTAGDEERALRSLLDDLRERSGIDFSSYKMPTIMRRLQRRIAATRAANLQGYIRHLQTHPDEYQRLVSSFLIKMTEFFRDPELFTYLREQIMPELIEAAGARGNELRFWSAGCATGEEVYSLAIVVAEALGDELERFNVRIFATDLDVEAVAFARRGLYPAAALGQVPPELIARYFNDLDGTFEIKKRVRNLAIFGQHDLGQRAPFPRIDLALCRNVLIYFTTELQKRALQLFAISLREGGYLVLGKAETTSPLGEAFRLAHPQFRIYRRQGDPLLMPAPSIREVAPSPPTPLSIVRRPRPNLASVRSQKEPARQPTSSERIGALLLKSPLGAVLVDRRYDIQTINEEARRLLGIHGPAVGDDLIHLAQPSVARDLRRAIDAAFAQGGRGIAQQTGVLARPGNASRHLHISCYAQPADEGGRPEVVLVLVADATDGVEEREALQQRLATQEETAARQMAELREELASAEARHQEELARLREQLQALADDNRKLLDANQELTTINMELRSANEEIQVTNEEAQAASEEVETLNEELQATNEELETLNEELQATVEELNTTNDDLQARTMELQSLAIEREAQRQAAEAERERFAAILASMPDAVLVLDANGAEVLANAAYRTLFSRDNLVLEDAEGRPLPEEQQPRKRAARGETFTMRLAVAGSGEGRRWFEARGQPIRGEAGAQDGSMLVIREVDGA